MAEITALHIAILAGTVAAGAVIGWLVRGSRCTQEKIAVNEGWQQQLEAQRAEHARLVDQNKGLMEQVNQFQASGKDATNRARELSGALKEAFDRRDELQRELKEIRSNLEVAVRQRDKLKSDIKDTTARGDSAQSELKRRDDKIFRLSRELENWQNRLPPLLDRYRERDDEAARLEEELGAANERIDELENRFDAEETRVESSGPETLGEELDASNDPEAPGQTASSEAAADDTGSEATFSEFVEEIGTDFEEEDRDDDDGDADETSALVAAAESIAGNNDEAPEAMAEADDETSVAESIDDGEIDDESGDVEPESVEADEVDDGDEYEPASVEVDDNFDSDVIVTAADEAEEIIDDEDRDEDRDEDKSGETETADEEEALTGEADETDDWGSATSAEITRLEDHGPGTGHDDLKLIKGIGPAIEKTLNELGIFRFDQIADMSEYDIERVARRLRGFRSRIYREDWIGQARDLQLQKTAN